MIDTTEKFIEIETYGVEYMGKEHSRYNVGKLIQYCRENGISVEAMTKKDKEPFLIR